MSIASHGSQSAYRRIQGYSESSGHRCVGWSATDSERIHGRIDASNLHEWQKTALTKRSADWPDKSYSLDAVAQKVEELEELNHQRTALRSAAVLHCFLPCSHVITRAGYALGKVFTEGHRPLPAGDWLQNTGHAAEIDSIDRRIRRALS